MVCKRGLFNSTPFRLIGQRIKRNIHFPARTHPRDFYFSPDVKSIIQLGCTYKHTPTQHSRPSWRSRWSQAERAVVRRREEAEGGIESLTVDLEQVSRVFILNLCQQHTFFFRPPPPQLTLGFTLLCNKVKQRAVSSFNSPIPSSHYSPNYCHPIHQFLCSSWHVTNITTTVQR